MVDKSFKSWEEVERWYRAEMVRNKEFADQDWVKRVETLRNHADAIIEKTGGTK